MLPTRDPPQNKRHSHTEVKGWKQISQANGQERKAGVAILISDKIDFKKRDIKRDPDGHFIIFKVIHQEDINIVNIYAPNIGAPKHINKTLIMTSIFLQLLRYLVLLHLSSLPERTHIPTSQKVWNPLDRNFLNFLTIVGLNMCRS